MERVTSLKSFGAPQVPPEKFGAPKVPQIYLFYSFLSPPPKAAVAQMGAACALTGAPKTPKGGAEGATLPEGEGNPAEGGSSRVLLDSGLLFHKFP